MTGQELGDTTYWKRIVLAPDLKAIKSVKDIDPILLSRFKGWKDMSDPGRNFNASDSGSGPSRRLAFAYNLNNNWIICYEHGGIGYHHHLFFITIDEKEKLLIKILSTPVISTFDDIKQAARENHFVTEYWDIHEY